MDKAELKWWQTELRARKVAEFGEIGLKTDCHYYGKVSHLNDCRILNCGCICESEVCHFYKKKG